MATTSNFGWPTPDDGDAVSQGAAAIRSLGSAVDATVAAGYLYAGTRYYTSSGTFAKADPLGTGDIGLRAIRVRLVGGGGGGSGAATTGAGEVSGGAGGGGGGYAERFVTDVAGLSASETVTVGSGGAGASAGLNNGSTGGTSSAFSASATGGVGGSGGTTAAPENMFGAGGVGGGAGGTFDRGTSGTSGFGIFAQANTRVFQPGGGSSLLGLNNLRSSAVVSSGTDGATPAATSYGCGGSGGVNAQSQATARAGGAGQAGIVIVDCFV